MRSIFLALTLLIASTIPATAEPSLAQQEGSWICLSGDQTAPQILVDFEENIYRRCDQNTCSLYDILNVQLLPEGVRIFFAPGASLRATNDGSRYIETLMVGSTAITASGGCSFRATDPEPEMNIERGIRQQS